MGEAPLSPHRPGGIASTAPNTFDQTWSPSNIATLDESNLPLPKAHRAWERVPQPPREKDARYRKVWRRYGLRSQADDGSAEDDQTRGGNGQSIDSRERAIKRQCLSDIVSAADGANDAAVVVPYAGTKYDRRKSGYIRKTRPAETRPTVDGRLSETGGHNGASNNTQSPKRPHLSVAEQAARKEQKWASRSSPDIRKRNPLGRHSLGSKAFNRRLSSQSPQKNSNASPKFDSVDALCLSPRKRVLVPSMPVCQEDVEPAEEAERVAASTPPSTAQNKPMVARENDSPVERKIYSPELNELSVSVTHDSSAQSATPKTFGVKVESLEDHSASHPEGMDEDETYLKRESDAERQSGAGGDEETVTFGQISAASGTAIAFSEDTTHLDFDTALLKDFLSRTAAAKASKLPPDAAALSVGRRSSLMNRRDSDVIRSALASPRKPLDDKDPNSALSDSPTKILDLPGVKELAAQLPAALVDAVNSVDMDSTSTDVLASTVTSTGSRRSARNRSRLPAPSAAATEKTPSKTISVKRAADGSDPTIVVIKKTEAQELSILTRANTRRNKGSSVQRHARLKKLRNEGMAPAWEEGTVKDMPAINASENAMDGEEGEGEISDEDQPWKIPADGEKGVRWRPKEELLSFLGFSLAPEASLSQISATGEDVVSRIPAPSSLTALSAAVVQAQTDVDSPKKGKSQAPRMRRLRGLGAANGTPAKGLLSSTLLPEEVAEERESEQSKAKLPSARGRKSRLATPRKLALAPVTVGGGLAVGEAEAREGKGAQERRLASPKKISQFKVAPITGGRGRKKAQT